jgi:hypothetical protein
VGLRDKLSRLETETEGLYQTLTLPDGTKVHFTGEEMVDAVIAAIHQEEHHLLPYIRKKDTNQGMPGLVRALEASHSHDA